jgi:hypothetical protein
MADDKFVQSDVRKGITLGRADLDDAIERLARIASVPAPVTPKPSAAAAAQRRPKPATSSREIG